MKFLCLVYMEDTLLGRLSPQELATLDADSLDYNEVLQRHGRLVGAEALQPPSSAASVRVRSGNVSATDGPFAETKEHLGGFILLEARDRDDAVRVAAGIPLARLGATIEVRPIFQIPGADAPGRAAGSDRPEPRIEARPALSLAGISASYTAATLEGIGGQWMRFVGEVRGAQGFGPSLPGLAYAWVDGAMELFTATDAPAGAPLPAGWQRRELPAQRYAIVPHRGHVSAIPRSVDWVLSYWLPASGHEPATAFAGGLGHLERFGPGFDPRTGQGDIELWFPVR